MKIDKDCVCAVTGAGRGLGLAIAGRLAGLGAKVYGCDVGEAACQKARETAAQNKWNLDISTCDVSDEQSVAAFFERINKAESRLDVLVNNAGITRDGLLIKIKDGQVFKMSLSDFQSVIQVNLTGVFLCAREATPLLAKKGGVIIGISSVCRSGNFGQTNYSAAKAGVDAMTVTWSKELAKYKIRTAAIAPGYLKTEMVSALKPEVLEKITAQVPLKRLGEMSEIAATVQFIVENDFINGRVLEIDGGLRV